MKTILFVTFLITAGFTCRYRYHPPRLPNVDKVNNELNKQTRYNIDDANQLGIDDKSNQETFGWYGRGYSGVMLEIPNGTIKISEEDSMYVSACYIDATEVCNLHYRTFIEWNERIFQSLPQVAPTLLPDTTVWLKQFPNQAIGGLLKDHYFRDPAFNYYPVVGVTWEQAQAYAFWRTDRINEAILVHRKKIQPDFEGQIGENHFSSLNYLEGMYEATPGNKPMVNPATGEERRVHAGDNILLPYYRLPTASELEHAATQTRNYKENKELAAFRKKIEDNNKRHPMPAYYDHHRYNLPYSVMESETNKAPYHLDDNADEWTQQSYNTSEQYNMHYHHYDDGGRPYHNYLPMWVKQAMGQMGQMDTNVVNQLWFRRATLEFDTNVVNKIAQQHSIKEVSHYRGFRCVMPNLW